MTPDRHPTSFKYALLIVALASRLVPGTLRDDWRSEWEGEMHYLKGRMGPSSAPGRTVEIFRRAFGALTHALWLRSQQWRIENMNQDIKFALRVVRKNPLYSAIVIGTIAIGIGANTAIFSVVNGVLLEPLPYDEPSELAMIWERNFVRDRDNNVVSGANFVAWSENNSSFKDLAAVTAFSTTVLGDGEAERVGTVAVTQSFFPLLGVNAVLGRVFAPEDDVDGGPDVILISNGYWARRFGKDPDAIGSTLNVNGDEAEIIGVLPEGFHFDLKFTFNFVGQQDIWIPQQFGEDLRTARGRWLQVLGRLKPGVTFLSAQDEMNALAQRYEEEFPDAQSGWGINVVPLHTQVVGDVATGLWLLLAAVGCVLLIAVANVANLSLARATVRQQEMAVRTAMGAGRMRMVRQMMTESLVLAAAGGLLGLLISKWALVGLQALGPDLPRLDNVALDLTVLLWALAISVSSGVLFGLLPAFKASRTDVSETIREGDGRSGVAGPVARLRDGIVITEIAISLVLLVGAGLLVRSFANLTSVDPGFNPENVLTFQIQLRGDAYPNEQRASFFQQLAGNVEGLPGIRRATAITFPPLAGSGSATSFWANDRETPDAGDLPVADLKWALPSYLETMEIALVEGRFLSSTDVRDGNLVVVINQHGAETIWPGENPIGKSISMPWGDTLIAEVVGVVENTLYNGPDQEIRTLLYWSPEQFQTFNFMTVMARTEGDPLIHLPSVRNRVAEMDPTLPVYNARTMSSYAKATIAQTRFAMAVLGVFSVVALTLASIGVYGIMAYSVGERRRELGIRMALGAAQTDVVSLVIKSGLKIVAIAIAIGVLGSIALATLMDSFVFGIQARDPLTLLAVSGILTISGLAACYIPARRAGRIAPTEAIRYD